MKISKILIVMVLLYGCQNNSKVENKTKNVQNCLDLLFSHQRKSYDFLEKCQLILIKDQFTSSLGSLHYGNNKLILKEVLPSEINVYYLPTQDTSKRYIIIKYYMVDDDTIKVVMLLPNGNQNINFLLNREGALWRVKITEMGIS